MSEEETNAADTQGNTDGAGSDGAGSSISTVGGDEGTGADTGEKDLNFLQGDKTDNQDNTDLDDKGQEGEKKEGEGEGEKDKAKTEGEDGVIEYEPFTVPESFGELDAENVEAFTALAREDKLPQAQAQKYVDLANKIVMQEREFGVKQWTDTTKGWKEEVENSPELGGEKMNETRIRSRRAVEFLNDPKLFKLLDEGFGNNPSIVRALTILDKLRSESKSAEGASKIGGEQSLADVLYPTQGQ